MKRLLITLLALIVLIPAAIIVWQLKDADDDTSTTTVPAATSSPADAARLLETGRYLARAGDCMACHTARSGKEYAGGRAVPTPFGTIYTPNITSDEQTGIGKWNAGDFWRALHHGKSKDGSFLYPAFPFTEYTKISRGDSDALFAYMKTVAPVAQANRENALRFPYNQRILLAFWRALYFRPGVFQPDTKQSMDWNRGAYLVQGLGHCAACHTTRNALGATSSYAPLAGGLIPVLNWYAPSLTSDAEAGLGNWELQSIHDLLRTGVSTRSTVFGPMAEVVGASLQYLSDSDIKAMALYLKSLPQNERAPVIETPQPSEREAERIMASGAILYKNNCAECHKASGAGIPLAYPPLSGNRAITMGSAINPIRIVLNGGFPPTTTGNPRPYGMPPFSQLLSDQEIADVVSYIRNSWENKAGYVSPAEVNRSRAVPLDD
ncbi:cytochrome c [Herbaspirillum sp. RTI4]|uniref:cytochrome c n=1 Tax=Herbaspirillum sp. RTI4 TaxID=3048640 RepID=UPI002AB4F9C5|nr:cytochrome c [Herbaspirillum sp. RTI4]MDY7579578.1 cytochrome c [Herbaspirillum sp. RTI4]MEA9981793.1 cytochrome c [Herbaspirillum sp. RTI4]